MSFVFTEIFEIESRNWGNLAILLNENNISDILNTSTFTEDYANINCILFITSVNKNYSVHKLMFYSQKLWQ